MATDSLPDPVPDVVLDPRRWFTLAVVILAVLIAALDTTILNVAIPTILRDLHTTLPSLQWVIAGYALTFASLLIIGGRLADLFGARRMFVIGAALFGVGSLLASLAQSVPVLILGEAFIEGMGASLMMPATLGILSTTFHGRERATAFAMWGATAGAAVAFGPLLGGFLTTNYSWRWAFRINVVVVPLTIIGAMVFMRRSARSSNRERIDVPGALLVAAGMFLLVFSLSQGSTYGWIDPLQTLTVAGRDVWPASLGISVIPVTFVASIVFLTAFVVLERWKEREGTGPLFEFGQLRHLGFRYGLMTTMVLATGQLGLLFVLPVFLQEGRHLSALDNGIWLLPSGISIVIGAQLGGRLTRRMSVTAVVRTGLVLEAVGLALAASAISPTTTFLSLLPGLAVFGLGVGFASSQLTNVVLSEIPQERAGAASGANSTVRQLGAGLGIAVIGALLTTQTIKNATTMVRSASLPTVLKAQTIVGIHTDGVNFRPPAGTSVADLATLRHALDIAVADGARVALLFAMGLVIAGALVSLLIPKIGVPEDDDVIADTLDSLGPVSGAGVQPTPSSVADAQATGDQATVEKPPSTGMIAPVR